MVAADALHIVGIDDLDVRERIVLRGYPIGRAGRLDRVDRSPHRRVVDGVDVEVEASQVESAHEFQNDGAVMLQLAGADGTLVGMIAMSLDKGGYGGGAAAFWGRGYAPHGRAASPCRRSRSP